VNRQNKSRIFITLSVVCLAASGNLFYRAETIRRVTYDSWVIENSSPGFTVYPTYDERWFTEDFLAVALFLLASATLIYGVWLKKSGPKGEVD
jgi:hypothetical protein